MSISKYCENKKVILFSPNLNGGGTILLARLMAKSKIVFKKTIISDSQYSIFKNKSDHEKILILKKNIFSRFYSEVYLFFIATKDDLIICPHGFPPLFPTKASALIFFQNRLLLEPKFINLFNFRRKLTLLIGRYWVLYLSHKNCSYVVFTDSMLKRLGKFLSNKVLIEKKYFLSNFSKQEKNKDFKYNLIYPASSDPHKNHINLIKALVILSKKNIFPSLILTLKGSKNIKLLNYIYSSIEKYNLQIILVNEMPFNLLLKKYFQKSSALIYPSICESIGLPLIEASKLGMKILASDLDFTYDVVLPDHVFNPYNPKSISNAIQDFLSAPV